MGSTCDLELPFVRSQLSQLLAVLAELKIELTSIPVCISTIHLDHNPDYARFIRFIHHYFLSLRAFTHSPYLC